MRTSSDAALVERLRAGEERAFAELVDAYGPSLVRIAMTYVSSRAVAEEVVQETWLGVVKGIDRFQGRSSLRTWIFRILANTARTRGAREHRTMPFSALGDDDDPAVGPDRFFASDHPRYAGDWALGPTRWETPEEGLLSAETREVILESVEHLPPPQRAVVTLRDIEGWPAEEVCEALGVSAANQRVLLHRGRARVRAALERYYGAVEPTVAEVA